ncbi:uncharacterized protein [Anabrus simplex]|uniref:uncharacterized protein n=1 Tax=Anabrus simplex TaxID=316456 RepID=UPI0035A2A5FD
MIVGRLLMVALLAALSTTAAASRCLTDVEEVNPKRFLHYRGQILTIRLETSGRLTHRLSTHVFRIFLEEVLGYPNITIVQHKDNFNESQAVERLRGGLGEDQSSIPSSTVNLEVWLPPQMDIAVFANLFHVKDCGNVSPPGRFGWFIPSNFSHRNPGMDHWRIFADPMKAKLFDLSENDLNYVQQFVQSSPESHFCEEDYCTKGMYIPERCKPLRHKTQPCAFLFAAYPADTGFVKQDIDDLHLFVKVVWVGPHLLNVTKTLTERILTTNANRSLVVLSWLPSPLMVSGETSFTLVTFPYCKLLTGHCRYEIHKLVKLSWAGLEDGAKPAYEAVHKFHFEPSDYRKLMDLYEAVGEENPTRAACQWMRQNAKKWNRWVPTIDEKNILFVGGIFPLTGSAYTSKGIVRAAQMALEAVNTNDSVLRDYRLELKVDNGQCEADVVMKTFIDYITYNLYQKLVGILGPACSNTVEPLAGITRHFKTVVISYSAEGSSFSDRSKYPYFFRTIGENRQYTPVYVALLKKMGWKRVAALTEDGQKYTEYISHLQDSLHAEGIAFVHNRKFPRDRERDAMRKYLEDMKKINARIIIGDVYDQAARDVMCQAYKLEMTAKQGYVWFLPLWLSPDWYNTTRYVMPGNGTAGHKNEDINCTTAEMIEAINGHLAMTHAFFAPDDHVMQENIRVKEWKEKYRNVCHSTNTTESNYAGYAYDAVWTYAFALDQLSRENETYLTDLHSDITTKRYVEILQATDFHGVSGRIRFVGGPSRVSTVNIVQWLNNKIHVVGTYHTNVSEETSEVIGGYLDLNMSALVWLSPNGQKPDDGTEPPMRCVLASLAELLDVSCEVAIVVANIMGFGLLGILLIIGFIMIKRRYEMKVKMTQKYMKSLGIDLLAASNVSNLDKWEIPRDHVVINRKLGEGAFGTVYGGEAHFSEKGWVAVAVKTLKVGSTTEEKLDFLSEAEVMKRFDHKNIVKLLGVCTKNEPVYTVMEFMLYGDLKTFLLARRHLVNDKIFEESDEISSKKLTSMALDVARALGYLAELKYVHRDVASRNCLVNAQRVVKLGDFGMTRPMFENDYYKFNRKGMLPVRWMSPESLELGIFTPSSDVWSYGVLLYEIITFGSFPFQGLSNNQVLEHVKAGNTLSIPAGVKPQLECLIQSCWNLDSKKRPRASEIVEFLANNPRLIAPCLDMPLASVQMEDTGQLEMQLPEKFRKCSVSLSFKGGGLESKANLCPRSRSMSENAETLLQARDLNAALQDSGTGTSLLENGSGVSCAREPLLGTPRSSSSSSGAMWWVRWRFPD